MSDIATRINPGGSGSPSTRPPAGHDHPPIGRPGQLAREPPPAGLHPRASALPREVSEGRVPRAMVVVPADVSTTADHSCAPARVAIRPRARATSRAAGPGPPTPRTFINPGGSGSPSTRPRTSSARRTPRPTRARTASSRATSSSQRPSPRGERGPGAARDGGRARGRKYHCRSLVRRWVGDTPGVHQAREAGDPAAGTSHLARGRPRPARASRSAPARPRLAERPGPPTPRAAPRPAHASRSAPARPRLAKRRYSMPSSRTIIAGVAITTTTTVTATTIDTRPQRSIIAFA